MTTFFIIKDTNLTCKFYKKNFLSDILRMKKFNTGDANFDDKYVFNSNNEQVVQSLFAEYDVRQVFSELFEKEVISFEINREGMNLILNNWDSFYKYNFFKEVLEKMYIIMNYLPEGIGRVNTNKKTKINWHLFMFIWLLFLCYFLFLLKDKKMFLDCSVLILIAFSFIYLEKIIKIFYKRDLTDTFFHWTFFSGLLFLVFVSWILILLSRIYG